MSHANAPLTPEGRRRLGKLIVDEGWPIRRAADRYQVSPATASKWAKRYRDDQPLTDRPSRPHRSPNQLSKKRERRIIALRFTRRWGPHRISYHLGIPRSTVGRVLSRYRMPLLAHLDQATGLPLRKTLPVRYERSRPGELIQRFCQIIAEHVRVNDLTAPIKHVPGHTMQVDWAGTRMQIIDPISRAITPVSVFVASLPYSGLVFAHGYLDEKQPVWHDAHRRAFEYVGGVPLLVVPDNASTASNQISRTSRARDVNDSYAEFLEHTGPRPFLRDLPPHATRATSKQG